MNRRKIYPGAGRESAMTPVLCCRFSAESVKTGDYVALRIARRGIRSLIIPSMRTTNRQAGERIARPRSLFIGNHKTSLRLEGVMWHALHDIAEERGKTVNDLIIEIRQDHDQANLSSAIRVYIVEYYRAAFRKAQNAGQA
jgi:predicted DNA-binding ribbon-helix-helix protein